jgi:uncharacterized protein
MKMIPRLFLLVVLVAAGSQAQQDVPVLAQHVMDFTNSLTFNEWRSLEDRLSRVKDTAHTHIAILVIEKLSREPLPTYAERVFRQNKFDQNLQKPGLLIVVEKESKSAVIRLGAGMEQMLTDEMADVILQKDILPLLRSDNLYGALAGGVLAITDAVAGRYEMPPGAPSTIIVLVVGIILLIGGTGLFLLRSRRKKLANQ